MSRPSSTDSSGAANAEVVLRIRSLAAGGDGVAREESGRVVFVPDAAPGDLLRVRLHSTRKRFARGEILELLEAGPDRTEPGCPQVGTCGGCAWQHLRYAAQVEAKAEIVADALRRIGRFELSEPVTCIPSPSGFGYRGRARFLQWEDGLGYRARGSHVGVRTDRCPVLHPELEPVLRSSRPAQEGSDGMEWEAALGSDGRARLAPVGAPGPAVELDAGGHRLRVSHGVFAQANHLLLDALVERVVGAVRGGAAAVSAVELYAGAGLFTLPLSGRFDQLWAVEANPAAVGDLRFNLERAGRSNVRVLEGDTEKMVPRLGIRAPDALLVDPPRVGMSPAALDAVVRLEPARIAYLSCDPSTLARDLASLRNEGYRLRDVVAFDLFPQTPHVEALATLEAPGSPVRAR